MTIELQDTMEDVDEVKEEEDKTDAPKLAFSVDSLLKDKPLPAPIPIIPTSAGSNYLASLLACQAAAQAARDQVKSSSGVNGWPPPAIPGVSPLAAQLIRQGIVFRPTYKSIALIRSPFLRVAFE